METMKRFWDRLKNIDEKKIPVLIFALVAALVALSLLDVLNAWVRRYTIESEAAVITQMEELRRLDLAKGHDRNALEKERREFGLHVVSTEALEKLGDIFIRVGPYALLFFSIAQAWKIFEDQRSSRLRLALAVSFSVIVVGFVLIVGGYVSPTELKIGHGGQQTQITSESLGVVVVTLGAVMFMASFVSFRSKADKSEKDEA